MEGYSRRTLEPPLYRPSSHPRVQGDKGEQGVKTFANFSEVYKKCEEFGFNKEITAEMCWNEGYRLGRKRWHWGPSWMVTFQGWVNTQLSKLRKLAKGLDNPPRVP